MKKYIAATYCFFLAMLFILNSNGSKHSSNDPYYSCSFYSLASPNYVPVYSTSLSLVRSSIYDSILVPFTGFGTHTQTKYKERFRFLGNFFGQDNNDTASFGWDTGGVDMVGMRINANGISAKAHAITFGQQQYRMPYYPNTSLNDTSKQWQEFDSAGTFYFRSGVHGGYKLPRRTINYEDLSTGQPAGASGTIQYNHNNSFNATQLYWYGSGFINGFIYSPANGVGITLHDSSDNGIGLIGVNNGGIGIADNGNGGVSITSQSTTVTPIVSGTGIAMGGGTVIMDATEAVNLGTSNATSVTIGNRANTSTLTIYSDGTAGNNNQQFINQNGQMVYAATIPSISANGWTLQSTSTPTTGHIYLNGNNASCTSIQVYQTDKGGITYTTQLGLFGVTIRMLEIIDNNDQNGNCDIAFFQVTSASLVAGVYNYTVVYWSGNTTSMGAPDIVYVAGY